MIQPNRIYLIGEERSFIKSVHCVEMRVDFDRVIVRQTLNYMIIRCKVPIPDGTGKSHPFRTSISVSVNASTSTNYMGFDAITSGVSDFKTRNPVSRFYLYIFTQMELPNHTTVCDCVHARDLFIDIDFHSFRIQNTLSF